METVYAITRGQLAPDPSLLELILQIGETVILAGAIQECEFRLRSQTRQTKKLDRSISPYANSDVCAR